jgi:hypothetical protein
MPRANQRYRDIEPGTPAISVGTGAGRQVIAVVGIDRYDDWQRLHNAVSDAQGVRKLFLKLGFEEITSPLFDADATGEALRRLVTDTLTQLEADDSLVLFFAGHGHTQSRTWHDGRTVKTGYLVPVDGALPSDRRTASWIKLDSWMDDIARLPAKHILVILDACHSGVALGAVIHSRGGAFHYEPLAALQGRRSRRVITSALDNELALDSGPVPGHSLFTGCLIEALTWRLEETGQRVVTGSEIGLHLQRQVKAHTNAQQTPDFGVFYFDDRGEMVIPVLSEAVVQAQPTTEAAPTAKLEATEPSTVPPSKAVVWQQNAPAAAARSAAPTALLARDQFAWARKRVVLVAAVLVCTAMGLVAVALLRPADDVRGTAGATAPLRRADGADAALADSSGNTRGVIDAATIDDAVAMDAQTLAPASTEPRASEAVPKKRNTPTKRVAPAVQAPAESTPPVVHPPAPAPVDGPDPAVPAIDKGPYRNWVP